MSEMVERVARAVDPAAFLFGATKQARENAIASARRVIAAMREPTKAMGIAGSYHVTMAEGALTTSREDAECAWCAMIGEALES